MEVIIHRKIDVLDKIYPEWNQLKDEFHEITVFQDIRWIKSWWDYKKKKEHISPYILEIRFENKTIGIIPLYRSLVKFASLQFSVLKPIGSLLSDYLVPILSKKYAPKKILTKAFEKLHEDKDSWDFIEWGDIPENSIFDRMLRNQLVKDNFIFDRNRTFICPFLIINKDVTQVIGTFDKKLVKEIRKKTRQLKECGDLIYHKVTNKQDIQPILNKFFEFHCERYKNTNNPSRFRVEEERMYTIQTAEGLYKSNLLHLSYLRLNNEIISVEFAMEDGKNIYLYLTAFNMKYRRYSPGNILLYMLVDEACKQDYKIVDFTRGDESYKQQWGTLDKYNVQYVFYNNTIKSILYRIINSTYNSDDFNKEPILKQLLTKLTIRGCTSILSVIDRLRYKNVPNWKATFPLLFEDSVISCFIKTF